MYRIRTVPLSCGSDCAERRRTPVIMCAVLHLYRICIVSLYRATCRYDEEAPAVIDGARPPPGWPAHGAIEVAGLTVRYRPELDPVLQDLR